MALVLADRPEFLFQALHRLVGAHSEAGQQPLWTSVPTLREKVSHEPGTPYLQGTKHPAEHRHQSDSIGTRPTRVISWLNSGGQAIPYQWIMSRDKGEGQVFHLQEAQESAT